MRAALHQIAPACTAGHQSEIYVKCSGSDNVTSTVHGQRASSTSSAEVAAWRLAVKLYGDGLQGVVETDPGNRFVRRFVATGDRLLAVGGGGTGK